MTRFLSPDWFAMMNDAAFAVDPAADLVLEQHVRGGPEGDVTYAVIVRGGRLGFDPAGTTEADATVTLDYSTASALATGELTAQDAFLQGRVRVSGNLTRIQAAGSALAALTEALGATRDRTTY
jgi:putative sterol carrier protein